MNLKLAVICDQSFVFRREFFGSRPITPMYGPAVCCKRFLRAVGCGLASMYPACDWSIVLRAIMDISARAISLANRPRAGHGGYQCSHAPGRPILHLAFILSQTSAGWISRCRLATLPHLFLCSCRVAVPSPRPAPPRRRRAEERSRPTVALAFQLVPLLPRSRLEGSEHGATLTQIGRLHRRSASSRSCGPWPAPPRRCAQACWQAQLPARCGAGASYGFRSSLSAHAAPSSVA
jgi:hypothetical protein